MATAEFIYVLAKEEDLVELRATAGKCHDVILVPGERFARVVAPTNPARALPKLSKRYGEAVFLAVQTVVDAFQFERWMRGTCVRKLVYGCNGPEERTWEVVAGTPEPWEAGIFFSEERLALALTAIDECLAFDLAEGKRRSERARAALVATAEKEKESLRQAYAGRRFEIGAHEPSVSTPWDAIRIAESYGISNEKR